MMCSKIIWLYELYIILKRNAYAWVVVKVKFRHILKYDLIKNKNNTKLMLKFVNISTCRYIQNRYIERYWHMDNFYNNNYNKNNCSYRSSTRLLWNQIVSYHSLQTSPQMDFQLGFHLSAKSSPSGIAWTRPCLDGKSSHYLDMSICM